MRLENNKAQFVAMVSPLVGQEQAIKLYREAIARLQAAQATDTQNQTQNKQGPSVGMFDSDLVQGNRQADLGNPELSLNEQQRLAEMAPPDRAAYLLKRDLLMGVLSPSLSQNEKVLMREMTTPKRSAYLLMRRLVQGEKFGAEDKMLLKELGPKSRAQYALMRITAEGGATGPLDKQEKKLLDKTGPVFQARYLFQRAEAANNAGNQISRQFALPAEWDMPGILDQHPMKEETEQAIHNREIESMWNIDLAEMVRLATREDKNTYSAQQMQEMGGFRRPISG